MTPPSHPTAIDARSRRVPDALRGISSMATREVLAELIRAWAERTGQPVELESVGGVDAAHRVAAGEAFDFVVLAEDAMAQLSRQGVLAPVPPVPLMRSGVAACVPRGAERPVWRDAAEMMQVVLAAPSVGYSTGPSGAALLALFARWGVLEALRPRLVQARPGEPVATLVARGEVALGFQQLSELLHVPGIELTAPLPAEVQIITTFTGAVCLHTPQTESCLALLHFMQGPDGQEARARQGMASA